MKKVKLFLSLLMLFSICVGQVWAEAVEDTISMAGYAGNTTGTSYITTSTKGSSAKGVEVYSIQYIPKTGQVKGNQTSVTSQWSLYNSKAIPGAITSIEITQTGDTSSNSNKFQNNLFVALGKVSKSAVTNTTANDSIIKGGYVNKHKFLFSGIAANKAYTYFKIYSNEKFGSGTLRAVKVIVTYEVSGGGSQEPAVSVKQGTTAIETLNVPAAGATSQTLTLEYSNIKADSEGSNPAIAFYSNADCTSASGQTWFTATGTNKTTVTYSASSNTTGDTRTVYAVISNTVKNSASEDKTVRDTITISQASLVLVTDISVKASTSIEVGATETLTATVTPDNASDKTVTWSSDDDDIATVDENGKVTGVAVGNATITCKSVADNTITATCAVTVTEHVVTPGTYNVTLNNALFGSEATGSLSGDALHDYTGQQNDITFNYVKGSGSNMYMNASQIRLYKNITLVVSVPAGFNITEVTGLVANIAANVGSISNNTWTGKSNSITFSFTESSGNAQLGAISVTYEAIAPEVTVDPSSLSFTAKQNIAVEGKTFTLEGANLTSGLTLAASTGFSVSPTSLTAEAAMVEGGVEVTVTPATPTATTTPVEGTVTISGGGLASNVEVALSMAVTPTYAVAIAVNDGDMGSATINGGTASIYVTDDEEIALVATPAEHHEFVNWTVSDENIVLDNENAATTTALAGAAGTITANFQVQACSELAAPVLNEITKTYQSATIAWNAVANAEGYVLNITKHEDGSAVLTNELIVAPTVSFEIASGLAANTRYDYTIMAVGDGTDYCDANNPVLNSNFTTNDYPAATLSLVENGGTPYNFPGSHKLNDVVTLPSTLQGLGCTGKVLVGWTNDENFADTDDDPTGEDYYWAKGADYTIASTADKLYAVLATVSGGDWSKVEIASISEEDVIVVAGVQDGENYYGLSSAQGTSSSPTAVALTVEENTITEGVVDAIKWNLKGTSGNYTLYANGTDNYLYNTAATTSTSGTNTAWRVGQPASGTIRKNLEVSGTTLRTNESSNQRYLCQYNNADWRGYVNNTSTNAKTTLAFFKQSSSTTGYTISCTAQLPVLDAPEFSLAAGSYYDALQTVTLTATNSADIYYTLDGTEPTTESTKYTGAIALNDRGEYTIWAIAVKEGYETSEIAKRTYDIVLPYDFADFAALEKVNGKEYAVRGIISQKDAQLYSGKLPYWISADGQTAGQIKCHNGLKENKANFESVDEVNLGDNVTVVGTWSTQYSNLNAGNWMLEYTARVHASYAIEGELTASSFDDGDAFDDAILDNLTVKETFTNGYHENVAGVTFNAGEKTAWADGDTKLTVNAVLNEAVIATKDFDVTVSSAQLASIALKADDENYSTKVEYYLGDPFVAPTIVATLDDASSYEAVATYVSGFDNVNPENAGVQVVTVSYTRGTVTETTSYNITMKKIYNDESEPYTVTEALDIIINVIGSTNSADSIVVAGTVSAENINSNYNRYKISDGVNELLVYGGKGFGGSNFNSTNYPKVGDVVIVKGKVVNYQDNTPEFVTGQSKLLSQIRPATIAIEDVTGFEVGADDLEADDLTITTASNGAITFVSGDETIVSIEEGKLRAVAEGTATITANLAATANEGAINYKAASTTFDVTVVLPPTKYTITFDGNGADDGSDPEAIADKAAGAEVTLPANTWTKTGYTFDRWKVYDANDDEVTVTAGKFEMPASNVTIKAQWQSATDSKWVLVENLSQLANGDKVIIAAKDYDYALGAEAGGSTKYRSAVGVSKNGKLLLTTGSANQLTLGRSGNEFTFKVGDNFLNWTSGNSMTTVTESDENSTWLISFDEDGKMHIINKAGADSNREIQYNANSGQERFATYTASQKAVVIYKYLDIDPEDPTSGYERPDLTLSGIGTICLPYNVKACDRFGGVFYMPSHKTSGFANFIEETETLQAGKAYIFVAENEFIRLKFSGSPVSEPLSDPEDTRGLIGTFSYIAPGFLTGKYVVANDKLLECGDGAWLNANRAYLDLDVMPENPVQLPAPSNGAPRRRLGIGGNQVPTGFENIEAGEAPMKIMLEGQMFILRGERVYDATGRLVK